MTSIDITKIIKEIKSEIPIDKYAESAFFDLYFDVLALFSYEEDVVLYGVGKIGKEILAGLKFFHYNRIVAICDNYASSSFYDNIPVYKQFECLKRFPNSCYLISVQSGYFEIALSLKLAGVKDENIYWYDNLRKKVISGNNSVFTKNVPNIL